MKWMTAMTPITTSTLAIIPCTKEKIWDHWPEIGSVRAQDAYCGPNYLLAKSFVEDCLHQPWLILSAKHGLLEHHDQVPGFYDVTFDRVDDPVVSVRTLKTQIKDKSLTDFSTVAVYCNHLYMAQIQQAFDDTQVRVIHVFENMQTDRARCAWLIEQIGDSCRFNLHKMSKI